MSRHDKWLCMMYPRLALLRDFLTEDGVIFVSIDDNEVHLLRVLMDEIFGVQRHICQFVWKARQHLDSRSVSGVSNDHEYILAYGKLKPAKLKGKPRDDTKYQNPDHDVRGKWMSRSMLGLANKEQRPNLHYDLVDPHTNIAYKCPSHTGWRYSQETMRQKIEEDRIIFPKKPSGRPREKVFLNELQASAAGFPSVIDGVYTADGSAEIRNIFGEQVFAFPKPTELIATFIAQICGPDDIVLDSFAGSGTTGHAVLAQNKADGGNRRFITIEMDESICQNITAQRLTRVVEGTEKIESLGSGFRFCTLADPLFDELGNIRMGVKYPELAAHVYFTETGSPLPAPATTPKLGVHDGKAVYLLFNGILGDKRPEGGNILTPEVLKGLPAHKGVKVIYGEGCALSDARLRRDNIVFKQVPYHIQVS